MSKSRPHNTAATPPLTVPQSPTKEHITSTEQTAAGQGTTNQLAKQQAIAGCSSEQTPAGGQKYVCARCAKLGETCCTLGSGETAAGQCFPLSEAEATRIFAWLKGAEAADVYDYATSTIMSGEAYNNTLVLEKVALLAGETSASITLSSIAPLSANNTEFTRAIQNLFPFEREQIAGVFPSAGTHRTLALPDGKNCIFLSKSDGCVLPPAIRPWYCRIFPFWLTGERLQAFAAQNCLACNENKNIRELLKCFGVCSTDLLKMFKNLRRDWGVESGNTTSRL